MARSPILKEDARYIALLLLLSGLFFLPVVLHPAWLIYPSYSPFSDITVIHWPNAYLLKQTFREYGQIPLWKPTVLSGAPLIGNQLTMLFYPLNFLFLVLPINATFNLLFILHFFLAGTGMYLFARQHLSAPASFLAALSFAFSGKVAAHVAGGHVSMMGALAWLPWAFLFTHLAIAHRHLAWPLLAGMALALQITTHTQITVYTAYVLFFYALYKLLVVPPPGERLASVRRAIPRLALISIVFALLGGIQILPLLELSGHSNRALSLAESSFASLSWLTLFVGLFLPQSRAGHEWTVYPGLFPAALALVGFLRRRGKGPLFFAGMALFCLFFSLGARTPLFTLAYYTLPGLRWLRTPGRAFFLLALALGMLAGYGFEALVGEEWARPARRRLRTWGVGFTLPCFLLAVGLMALYGQISRATLGLALFPALGVAFLLVGASTRLSPARLGALAALILLLDLWTFDYTLLRFLPPEEAFADRREVAEYLTRCDAPEKCVAPYRTYSPSYSLPQHLAAAFDLEMADGAEPVHLRRYDEFMSLAGGYAHPDFSVTVPYFDEGEDIHTARRSARPNAALLGLLNVRYLAAEFPLQNPAFRLKKRIGSTYIYENEAFLPRAFIVPEVEVASDQEAVLKALPSLDVRRLALVEGEGARPLSGPGSFPPPFPSPHRGESLGEEAKITFRSPNAITVEAELEREALLILSEIWYPGWEAYDNGNPTPIYRADYILRGVYLGPGEHKLAFFYRPRSLQIGQWISALSLAGWLIALALSLRAMRCDAPEKREAL